MTDLNRSFVKPVATVSTAFRGGAHFDAFGRNREELPRF